MSKNRFPKNVPGDFYTNGECLACDLPEAEARHLMSVLADDNYDTYFVKQPETDEEIAQAIAASHVCCVGAVRYAGKDKNIIRRVSPDVSDFKISLIGAVVPADNPWWKIW